MQTTHYMTHAIAGTVPFKYIMKFSFMENVTVK